MSPPVWNQDPRKVRPMLAQLTAPNGLALVDRQRAFERKYDGVRCLASVDGGTLHLLSRNGNDKASQFPEIATAMRSWADSTGPLLVDGEIVALAADGEPTSFTRLQSRLPNSRFGKPADTSTVDVRYYVFDVLRSGSIDLRTLPFDDRRAALEEIYKRASRKTRIYVRLSDVVYGNGEALWAKAQAAGWEGLMAKDRRALYMDGQRTSAWQKLKVTQVSTFSIGGFTAPKSGGRGFGALVLGIKKSDGRLVPVGSVGSGFSDKLMLTLREQLDGLLAATSPFVSLPVTATPARWVIPNLTAEVAFAEWTPTQQLRHPVFLGWGQDNRKPASAEAKEGQPKPRKKRSKAEAPVEITAGVVLDKLVELLTDAEQRKLDPQIRLPCGNTLALSNLSKLFWPSLGLTKGDLLRYYVRISPHILPVVADRPLVMKRHPDGAEHGEPFYQHRAPEPLPPGARAAALPDDDVPARLIGGDLYTLLYMVQLGAISQDPWFSRLQSPAMADAVAFDLDPMPGVPFTQVRDVAMWLHEILENLQVPHFAKTSGNTGLHIFVPLDPKTPYEPARLFTQLVAAMVSRKHAKLATVERTVAARGNTVYIDCLQNIEGKTLACAYSARANTFAGASAPLTWQELAAGATPEDFTIKSLPARVLQVGNLWAGVLAAKPRLALGDVLDRLQAGG